MRSAPCEKLATMPAIAPIEDLKSAQRDYYSMFLAVTPDDLPACSKPFDLHSLGVGGWRRQAPHDLRLRMTLCSMRYALCEKLVTIER